MLLEAEGLTPINDPSDGQLKAAINRLRSYGPCSFASLTDRQGNFVQVGGGGRTCVIERKNGSTGLLYRAYGSKAHPVFQEGDVLAFGGSKIALRADEWLTSAQALMVFLSFKNGEQLSDDLGWREIPVALVSKQP